MDEIDFDIEENQEALRELYVTLRNHREFWDAWLTERASTMGYFFAPAEEIRAATAMSQSLLAIVALARAEKE